MEDEDEDTTSISTSSISKLIKKVKQELAINKAEYGGKPDKLLDKALNKKLEEYQDKFPEYFV